MALASLGDLNKDGFQGSQSRTCGAASGSHTKVLALITARRLIKCASLADIAVGAPYDGKNGAGAVYIFNGGKTGLQTTASQVSATRLAARVALCTL